MCRTSRATAALAVVPVDGDTAGAGEVAILSGGLDRDCSNLIWTDARHVTILAEDRGAVDALPVRRQRARPVRADHRW